MKTKKDPNRFSGSMSLKDFIERFKHKLNAKQIACLERLKKMGKIE